jgi:hypothetical protein
MSINSLTNAAAARRPDFAPINKVPVGLSEIAVAAAGMPAAEGTSSGSPPPKGMTAANGVNTAMNVLFGYIPIEVVTLYVAILAAVHPSADGGGHSHTPQELEVTHTDWVIFWIFLIATPLVLWVVFAAKLKSAQKDLPMKLAAWPFWEMCAATVAFAAWAFALPETPFRDFRDWYTPGLGTFAVLAVSTILGLLAPLFQNKLGT